MKQVYGDQVRTPENLPELYSPIKEDMDCVEELLRQELQSKHPFVDCLVKYGFRLAGKRLRPALVLLAARACGSLHTQHVTLAAAVEMIHTATLVHDDVLDEATIRRHLDTVNVRWDNETSVLLGDYLLTQALCLASSLDDVFACRVLGEASQVMCEGELRQVESRGNFCLSETQYFDIITGKTAVLLGCCCRLGAHYAQATPEIEQALSRYGVQLGIAFQIADDLLDMLGDEATVGKSLGTDLLKQKSTLPLIRLLDQLDGTQRDKLVAQLSASDNHRGQILRPWWDRCDAIAYTRQKAREFSRLAAAELDGLPASPARDSLYGLTEFVANRHH